MWQTPNSYPDLRQADRICIDIETCDPLLLTKGPGWVHEVGHIAGIAVATSFFKGYYPIGHEAGGNLPKASVLNWLSEQLGSDVPKVFHNCQYDVGWLQHAGVTVRGQWDDTQMAATLINEHELSMKLDYLAKLYLKEGKDETLLNDFAKQEGYAPNKVKENMWRFPPAYVGPYAEQDAAVTLKLWYHLSEILTEQDLWQVYNLEVQLPPILLAMRKQGVRVDTKKAEELIPDIEKNIAIRQKRLDLLGGGSISVNSSYALSRLYDKQGVDWGVTESSVKKYLTQLDSKTIWQDLFTDDYEPETHLLVSHLRPFFKKHGLQFKTKVETKGEAVLTPSFNAAFYDNNPSELQENIQYIKKFDKCINTFIRGHVLDKAHNGRVHPSFNQFKTDEAGTVTGRFSCSKPNLQQIPKRDPEVTPLLRQVFYPEEGTLWLESDYSQQEYRLMVHYAHLLQLPGAQDAYNYYWNDPDPDYHTMVKDMIDKKSIDRSKAKTINFGIAYTMGTKTLAKKLSMSFEQASELMSAYHKGVPFVKALMKTAEKKAKVHGYIRTILGRRCRFPYWEPDNYGYDPDMRPRLRPEALRLISNKQNKKWFNKPLRRAMVSKALNSLIQGGSADMTKQAMIDCYKAGYLPMLQIHDALAFSVPIERAEKESLIIKEIMEQAVPVSVPMRCDYGLGINWAEAK